MKSLIPDRIARMMELDHMELRVYPFRQYHHSTELKWSAAICFKMSQSWMWDGGEGDTMEDAVKSLLEVNAEDIERLCQEKEREGWELPRKK